MLYDDHVISDAFQGNYVVWSLYCTAVGVMLKTVCVNTADNHRSTYRSTRDQLRRHILF